jgi:trk system potassium uptake protein TrkA
MFMKFCVIGVGRLGYHVAVTLADNGMEVLAIDGNEAIIDSIRDKVSQAICMRITDEDDLRNIGVPDFDVVIVAMGENFAESILVTALLKQNLKIKRVITRSINKIHKNILLMIGADQVVLPEQDAGIKLADTLSLSFANLTRLTNTFSISYAKVPKKAIGKTIEALQELYNVSCIGKKVGDDIVPLNKEYILKDQDLLVYAGDNKDLEKLTK